MRCRDYLMTESQLRLIRRMALSPHLRPSDLARFLGVTRSSVIQMIHGLRSAFDLTIRGEVRHSAVGLTRVLGYVTSPEMSKRVQRLLRFLRRRPGVYRIEEVSMTSTGDTAVYFEAFVAAGDSTSRFLSQLERFRRAPYALDLRYDSTSPPVHGLNLALFDGTEWAMHDDFRLTAVFDVARRYSDFFTGMSESAISAGRPAITLSPREAICLGALAHNYFISAPLVAEAFRRRGLDPPSGRTLRRALSALRRTAVRPYLHIDNVGLPHQVLVLLEDQSPEKRVIRTMIAQAPLFPRSRLLVGHDLLSVDVWLPHSVNLGRFAASLSPLGVSGASVRTLVLENAGRGKELEEVFLHLAEELGTSVLRPPST